MVAKNDLNLGFKLFELDLFLFQRDGNCLSGI